MRRLLEGGHWLVYFIRGSSRMDMDHGYGSWILDPGPKGIVSKQLEQCTMEYPTRIWKPGGRNERIDEGKQIVVIWSDMMDGSRERQPWILDEPHEDAQAWPFFYLIIRIILPLFCHPTPPPRLQPIRYRRYQSPPRMGFDGGGLDDSVFVCLDESVFFCMRIGAEVQ